MDFVFAAGDVCSVHKHHLMKNPLTSFSILLTLISTAQISQAAPLVSWNFTSNTTPTIVAVSSVASAANATFSAGVSGGFQNNANGTNIGPNAGNGTWSTANSTTLSIVAPYALGTSDVVNGTSGFYNTSNYTTSPSAAKFVSFSLTMNSTIDSSVSFLEGIQFNLASAGTGAPRGVEVTYRIGTSDPFTSLGGTAVPVNSANQYGLFTFNLPTPTALSGGDVVEFRLLGYADAAGSSVRLDNVSITAVPEPTTAMLLVAFVGLVLLLRRRPLRL
jgi:hypothetical protein